MAPTITEQITQLKKERDAVILAHNYTKPEVQDIADITGDSLELSRKAAQVTNRVILFCGVRFMAETAKILNPAKTVLMPDAAAGCPMADMIKAEDVRGLRKEYPRAQVVCYVNSSAEVKAEVDICCTSSNALSVVRSIGPGTPVIFIPDKFLGSFVEKQLDRKLIFWEGFCPVHQHIKLDDLVKLKHLYPRSQVVVHPECSEEVVAFADHALSTGQMITFIKEAPAGQYIIGTETGMLYPLGKLNDKVSLIAAGDGVVCPNMKKNSLDKILLSLKSMQFEVTLDEDIMKKARQSLEKMISL